MDRFSVAVQVSLGLLSTAGGVATLSYAGFFYMGWPLECLSIDVASPWHQPSLLSPIPLLNNTLLLLIFFFLHSLLARQWCKDLLDGLSPSSYRHFYVTMSSLFLFLMCYGWSPQPYHVWHVEWIGAKYLLYCVAALGILLTAVGLFTLQPLEFFGLRKPLEKLLGTSSEGGHLATSGEYSYVRHPMYTGLIIAMCSHPTMVCSSVTTHSESRVLLCVALILYLLVAVPYLEEPGLIKLFGQQYKSYMQKTPMLFPLPSFQSPKSD